MAEHGDDDPMTRLLERAPAADPLARGELLRQVERGLFGRETALPRVGRYTLVRRIGSGGQGVVYIAHDPELDRDVALKLLLSGDAGDEDRQRRSLLGASTRQRQDAMPPRFRREAQAMAKLSHPNVATVYEVGWHEGTAFIAMELVEGRMLRDWLNERPRRIDEILDVMIQAGRGLAAAHARELVHRDFKPQNVMVTHAGVAKVLDFGLATLERHVTHDDRSPTASSPSTQQLTQTGTVLGTPAYMAPEQRAGEVVDARGDQYAYCVVLHEALWGWRPALEGEGATGSGVRRRGVPSWLAVAVERGLAVDPAQRWPSMDALLQVLHVGRRRPRARRAAIAAGSVLAVGALAIAGASVWGVDAVQRSRAMTACEQEGAAISDVFDDARADRLAAAFEATGLAYAPDTWTRARARVEDFEQRWQTLRTESCARAEVEQTLPLPLLEASRGCLDEQRDELDALLGQLEQPDAGAVNNAGTAIASLPRPEVCADEARLRGREAPSADPAQRERVASLRARLADVGAAIELGRYEQALTEAQAVLTEAVAIEWPSLVAQTKLLIGVAQLQLARHEEAHASLQDAFFTAGAANRDEVAFDAATVLVSVTGRLVRDDESLHWGRLAQMLLDRSEQTDDDGALLNNVGLVHYRLGDHVRALELVEQALVVRETVLGPGHPGVATVLNSLALVRRARGEHALAIEAYERALAIREETLGPDHPEVASSLSNLGNVYTSVGEYARGLELQERALAIRERALGPDHPELAGSLHNLSTALRASGDSIRARATVERAIGIWERALGPEHPDLAAGLDNLGSLHHTQGDYESAIALHERALAIRERAFGSEHPAVADSLASLGLAHHERGEYEAAVEIYERALGILRAAFGEDHPKYAHMLDNLGGVYLMRAEYERAREVLERALRIRERALDPGHPDVVTSLLHVGHVRARQAAWTDALAHYERALALRERGGGPPAGVADARFSTARALWEVGSDRPRALELATAAAATYAPLGESEAKRHAEVEAWLREHKDH